MYARMYRLYEGRFRLVAGQNVTAAAGFIDEINLVEYRGITSQIGRKVAYPGGRTTTTTTTIATTVVSYTVMSGGGQCLTVVAIL